MSGFDMSPFFIVTAVLAAAAVGLSKGGLPVVSMLAVPSLALSIPPITAAALLLPIYIASDMVGIFLYRRDFSRRNLAILVPAAIVGVCVGWATSAIISDRLVTLIVGSIGLIFCINVFLKRGQVLAPRPADVPRGAFWGILTGFTSFLTHAGGPPYQIYVLPQKLPKLVFAGTSTLLFAIVNLAKLVPYWALGQFSSDNFALVGLLMPVAIAGTVSGWWLVRIIPEGVFYTVVEIVLFLISLKLVADGLMG